MNRMRASRLARFLPCAVALALALPSAADAQTCNGDTLVNSGTLQPTTATQTVPGSVTSSQGQYYLVIVNQTGNYTFSLCAAAGGSATYDSYLCILDGSFVQLQQNDDFCSLQSQLTRSLTGGTIYYIAVSSFGSGAGSYTLAHFSDVVNGPIANPLVATPQPASGSWVTTATPALSAVVVASAGAATVHAEFSLDGGPFVDGSVVSSGQTSTLVTPALAQGAHAWSVRAHDSAGLFSTSTITGVTLNIDLTPPVAGSVNDGTAADIDWQTSTAAISGNWSGFSDPQSALTYAWAIGITPGGVTVQPFTSVGTATTATNSFLTLTSSGPYFVTVRATNAAGQQTTFTSDGVTILTASLATALAGGTVGQAYSETLSASFGTGPYAWTLET